MTRFLLTYATVIPSGLDFVLSTSLDDMEVAVSECTRLSVTVYYKIDWGLVRSIVIV